AIKNVDNMNQWFYGHMYALHLLAEFRCHEAYPHILKFYKLTEEQIDSLIGDCVTESLDRVTASVCDGDIAPLIAIYEDDKIYEYSRMAAFGAILILMNQGILQQEIVVEYIERKLKKAIDSKDEWLVTDLGNAVIDYRLEPLYGLMREAFDKKLVNDEMYDREFFEMATSKEERYSERERHTFIKSAWEELQSWACFGDETVIPKEIGRNDPCLCGSGKKYKKCCLYWTTSGV
ncbi:MAG: DUF1186 domain-containing protein, partial [bacterium]